MRFIDVSVEEHDAIPEGCELRFHALDGGRPVRTIRWETTASGDDLWIVEAVDATGARGQATATVVDDSSAGTSLLVHGGARGLRLRPADDATAPEVPEPYLLLDVSAAG